MPFLLMTIVAVFAITFLAAPGLGAGIYWDAGNALGFGGLAGLLCLAIASNRPIEMTAHKILGYAVLFVCVAHVFWFLVGDPAVAEYLKPGAPLFMWTGLTGVILLGLTVSISLLPDRNRIHRSYSSFRLWHFVLAFATIAATLHHVIGNGFYVRTLVQIGLLLLLTAGVVFGRERLRKSFHPTPATTVHYLLAIAFFGTVFVAIRNMPA